MKPGKELLFLALGGSGEIGMNVNLYGCDGKWLMVDLGISFPDETMPGVEHGSHNSRNNPAENSRPPPNVGQNWRTLFFC